MMTRNSCRALLGCCLLTLAGAALGGPAPLLPRGGPHLAALAAPLEATRTQLVGLTASGDVRTTYTSQEVNLTKSPQRTFEARTTQTHASRLLWQVAVMPYPAQTGQAWQSPPGLVDCGLLAGEVVPDGKHAYPSRLDLGQYLDAVRLNQPVQSQGAYPSRLRQAGRTTLFDRWLGGSAGKQVRLGWARVGLAVGALRGPAGPKKTEKVVTFYLRVVPLDAKGQRVGAPSAAVVIRHNAQPTDFKFATSDPTIHPQVTPILWQPERHQDPQAQYWRLVVRRPPLFLSLPGVPQSVFTSVKPGEKYPQPLEVYWPPKDKSWWDKVCGAVGDFVSWVADVVNYVANLYSSLKGLVIDGLSQIAPELRGVFSVALDIGLVAVGIPPSLPDFDDLQGLGADYLCRYIADETGIPAGVTREALKQITAQTRDARHGGGDAGRWLVPDYNKLYRPARVDLLVTNPAAQSSDRVTVFCSVLAPTPQGQRLVAAGNPLPLAPVAPGETFTVPVYVQGAPEFAAQVRLYVGTQVRYELNDQGVPVTGKGNPYADQYNRLIRPTEVWTAAQLQQAPQP